LSAKINYHFSSSPIYVAIGLRISLTTMIGMGRRQGIYTSEVVGGKTTHKGYVNED